MRIVTKTTLFFICFLSVLSIHSKPLNDELYAQRLAALKSPVELTYNHQVKKYIEWYITNPEETEQILSRSLVHLPVIEKILKENQLPPDLKYLVIAVSGIKVTNPSPVGSSGIWNMMYNVARMYRLKINSFVDERRDPIKSTMAASAYFKDLYKIYNNWHLAIAAYGSTPINVNKAIRMAGGSLNYWEIYNYLPADSKDLVARYIAAVYILNYYKEHNMQLRIHHVITDPDSVYVDKWLSFTQISSTLNISIDDLRNLNPIFKKDIVPFAPLPYLVKLPKGKAQHFGLLKDSVYSYVPKPINFTPVAIGKADTTKKEHVVPEEQNPKKPAASKGSKTVQVTYKVKKGDVLGNIADWYDVTPTELRKWNKIKGNMVRSGQVLKIMVPSSKAAQYKKINTMTAAQKNKLRKKD